MKIPPFIISSFLVAWLASQGWLISEVINLKVEVSAIKQHITPTPNLVTK